jgi:hypothetical protein
MMAAERAAPYSWKPSTLLGSYGGNSEAAHLLTGIQAQRAVFAMQQEETARAQQEVVVMQATNERFNRAYDALFQRGTAMAQQWAAGATQALVLDFQTRAQVLHEGMGGVSSSKDSLAFLCDFGTVLFQTPACGDALRGSARQDRDSMSTELVANYKRQSLAIAQSLHDWNAGLPDPAELMVMEAAALKQATQPAPRQPVPPSPVYEWPPRESKPMLLPDNDGVQP